MSQVLQWMVSPKIQYGNAMPLQFAVLLELELSSVGAYTRYALQQANI
jgi:hypothetical protein